MVRNAEFVESILQGDVIGKRAQNGFDLSLKDVKLFEGTGVVYKNKTEVPSYKSIGAVDGFFVLNPGTYSITFNEGGLIPQEHCAWIKTRSSLVRNGCIIESGLYDTAFSCDSFGAVLFVHYPVKIEKDSRVAQLILFEAEKTVDYSGQWMGEKDKK